MNKYYGAFLFFILVISTSNAQDPLTDSLQSAYANAANDAGKAQALIAIAKHEWIDLVDDDAALSHLKDVLTMASQKGLLKPEAEAKLWLGTIYFISRNSYRDIHKAYELTQQALVIARKNGFKDLEAELLISLSYQIPDKTDSVKLLMKQAYNIATANQLNEQQVDVLKRMGIFYASLKFEESKSYFFQALSIARQYHLPRLEISVLRNLASTYSLAHLTDSANYLFQMAVTIARENQLVDLEISMLRTMISSESGFFIKDSLVANYDRLIRLSRQYNKDSVGTMASFAQTCTDLGDYPRALKASLILLHAEEEKKDSVRVEGDLYQIGLEYEGTKDYQRALEYLYRAKSYGRKDRFINMFIHDDLAKTYLLIKNKDSARYYADKSYQLAVEFYGSEANVYGGVLNDLGDVYFQLGEDSLAIDHLRRSYVYFTTTHIEYQNYCATTIGLAKYFKKTGMADSSNYYAKLCLNIAKDKGFLPIVTEASGLIAEYFSNKHHPDSAYYYQQIGFEAYKTLFSDESNRQFQNMTFAEQQRIQDIANEKKIAADQFKSKLQLYGLLTVLLVAVMIGALIYRNNRQKQRSYNLLKLQKQEIDTQKAKLEDSIKELQSTQSQLIQSEKMASLGELTAGIAHEIQNPLNFVNNFSEVNKELLAEMNEAIGAGKYEEASAIAKDVTENQEKINHHGKRAEAIVKGMLQHSRSGSSAPESTNVNELADEYLRLAFHGLRARDKNFNAEIKTDYDKSTGNILLIPQEIGRVLLNLYNNAFYAVTEKKKQLGSAYQPVVTVNTHRLHGKVEIRIKDNGKGIPQKIVDKIFQPFFTTKPTGEGTGLGLSLSYDIIKAHRGEINVETKEGEGTEFILHLPI